MYLRALTLSCLLFALEAGAQITITRGASLSVDATTDGRLAIDLRGDIWIVPGGGGEARQLTQNLKSAQRPRWSPNGEHIVYSAVVDGLQGIWIYALEDNEIRNLSSNSNFDLHPAWHPDGQRVLYSSDVGDGGFDLWEVDLPTGLRWRISDRPGDETEGAWSANGRDLVYVHHLGDQWSLILRRHSQPEETLLTSKDKIAAPTWRPDDSLITFFKTSASGTSIEMVILSQPRLIRAYASNEQFVVSPVSWLDRHRMYYSANGQIRQRLFNSWTSSPLQFRATIQPEIRASLQRERPTLAWLDEPKGSLVIHASRLFDGISGGYQYDKDILIEGGRIAAVANHEARPGTIVIDMGDLTILPGLIDVDARLPGQLGASHGPDLLTTGVTTIVGSHPDLERLNSLWAGKQVPGPRMLDAGQWQPGPTSRPELDVTAAVVTSRSTGLPTGAALPTQFRAMQIAGLTPEQSLRGVGVNAAGAMLADPYLGRIATGAAADLVFVDGDPLADISHVLNVVAVVRNGRFYSVSGLIDRAKSAESVE
ncbi:MAG: amidohydrolase family protein [Gammaproteobacteria bacterium]|nr:amidohydrolase family protein [Gammaproteobacteria bacterium]